MAIDLSAGIATQLNGNSQRAVTRAARTQTFEAARATTPSRGGPAALGLSLEPRSNISISASNADRALTAALATGQRIISDLRMLEGRLGTAVNQSLVSSVTELRIDETRVSRLNITVAASRAISEIDRLVAGAERAGVNLISSQQGRVTIQTTEFGGRVTVQPQPLDGVGLDLRDLSALSVNEALEARDRVRIAIATATSRLKTLSSLGNSLDFRFGDTPNVVDFGTGSLFEAAARGRLVDLQA